MAEVKAIACELPAIRGAPISRWSLAELRAEVIGIAPFGRLVDQVMTTQPYASAHRVYWIVDNGSSHRGQASIDRLQGRWPNLRLIHLPVHASWLNQVVRHEAAWEQRRSPEEARRDVTSRV